MTYIIIFFIVIAIVLYNWFLKLKDENYFLSKKEKEDLEERQVGHNHLIDMGCLAYINTRNGLHFSNQKLILDFILDIYKPSKAKKERIEDIARRRTVVIAELTSLTSKDLYPEYIEIWGDEDESKLISIIRNIEKDSHKTYFRWMLRDIYSKARIEKNAGVKYGLFPKYKKIFQLGVLGSHLSRHPISPRFFSCPDDKFLEIINSGKNFLEENEITKPDSENPG